MFYATPWNGVRCFGATCAMKSEIQRIRSFLILHRTEEENEKCQLRVSLVPFDPLMFSSIGGGDRDGTYIHMLLKSEGAYDEEIETNLWSILLENLSCRVYILRVLIQTMEQIANFLLMVEQLRWRF